MKAFTILLLGLVLAALAFRVEAIGKCKDAEANPGEGDLISKIKKCMDGLKNPADVKTNFQTCTKQFKDIMKNCVGDSKLFKDLGEKIKGLMAGAGAGGKAGLAGIKDGLGKVFGDIQGKFKNLSGKFNKGAGGGGAGVNANVGVGANV